MVPLIRPGHKKRKTNLGGMNDRFGDVEFKVGDTEEIDGKVTGEAKMDKLGTERQFG